jgi:hypothetical protein
VSGGATPLSEPETRALYNYVLRTQPMVVLVLHCCGSVVEANESPRAVALAHEYADASGLRYIDHWNAYMITGQFLDAMDRAGIAAIDIEMTRADGPALEAHRAGLLAVLARLAAGTP